MFARLVQPVAQLSDRSACCCFPAGRKRMLGPADRQLSDLPHLKRTAQQEQPAKVMSVLCSLKRSGPCAAWQPHRLAESLSLLSSAANEHHDQGLASHGVQEVTNEVPSQLARKVRLPSLATSCEFHPKLPSLLLSKCQPFPQSPAGNGYEMSVLH